MAQQKIIPVSIPKEFDWIIKWLDQYGEKNNKSQFIREAIAEKINRTKTDDLKIVMERLEKLEQEVKNNKQIVYIQKEESNSDKSNGSDVDNSNLNDDLFKTASMFDM